jgi:Tol biopolymer transport system component
MSLAYQPVVNGEGSLTVDLKFYKKLKSSSTWSLFYTISDWEITGTSCWGWTAMTGGNHDEYDWKIEIYRSGISTPDYTRDPSNDGDLNDYKMETPSQDQGLEPDLSYLTHEIDDDNSGGSSGNGDGAVNPGETIELILTLENTGSAHAHNVSAQLSTSDAYVTISDADENYGDIAAGYTGSCQADYDFTVASSCPDGHVVTFNLNIQSDEGSWSDSFQITVTTVVAGRATKQILSVYSGEHAVHPRCSPDGTKISYGMYSSTEGFEIWVMNSYGSGSPKKIVSDAFPEDWMDDYHLFLSSSWSPDGEKIAYTKGEGTSPSETLDIWTINSDGSGIPLQITTTGKAIMPSWSPDGKKIAYLSDANDQIWVVNSDGTGTPEQITNSGDICVWPSWSPDGKKIAYTSFIWETGETDLWVGNSDGTGNPLKIVSDVFLPSSIDDHVLCAVTSWSPDGAKICYFSDGGIEGNHGIWVTNSDGSGTPQPITSNTNDGSWSPSCCSDGTKIVYSIYHNPGPGEYFSDLHMTDYLYGDDAFPAGNIVSPILNQHITGISDVIGTVTDNISVDGTTILSSFSSWTLEYGEGEEPETWTNIVTSSTYKSNELLASWDTSALALETYTLRLRATDGVDENVQSVTVLRIGHEPDITVTDSIAPADDLGLPFGEVQEGDFSEATVTMTNDGTADLAIYDIASANPLEAPFSIESDTCSNGTVPPGASCSLTVRFNPDTTDTFGLIQTQQTRSATLLTFLPMILMKIL